MRLVIRLPFPQDCAQGSPLTKKFLIFASSACSAGVFFGRANVFARETEERRKWGESKGAGRRRGERRENACPKTL